MGQEDWSEYTPGYDAEISCLIGKWSMGNCVGSTDDFRDNIENAEDCDKFEFDKYIIIRKDNGLTKHSR